MFYLEIQSPRERCQDLNVSEDGTRLRELFSGEQIQNRRGGGEMCHEVPQNW